MHSTFIKVLTATLIAVAGIYFFWPPVLWVLLIIAPFAVVGIYDLFQKKHSIRRNFPLFGRGRWIMEEIRPFIRQYFVESDTDGAPINRMFRSIVYQRAKGAMETVPLPPCLIGIEACSGAHYWAREISKLGHEVRIMAPKFVIPYSKGGKNDNNDASAICEAACRPDMRFVPIKSPEQQALLSLHRVRQSLITQRTALINQLRGLLSEFGIIMPKGRHQTHRRIPYILEDAENGLLMLAREIIHDVWQSYRTTCEDVLKADLKLSALAREKDQSKRLMTI